LLMSSSAGAGAVAVNFCIGFVPSWLKRNHLRGHLLYAI
jgi:hypothetical protein